MFFSNGRSFEFFCFGPFSIIQPFRPITRRKSFDEVVAGSIIFSLNLGFNEKKLKRDKAFFWRVFCEVRQHIPKEFRRFLRVAITVGTDLDYHKGCDILFILGKKVVPVDVTLIIGKDLISMIYKDSCPLIFNQSMLDNRSVSVFAQKIANMLMDADLGILVSEDIYNKYRNYLYRRASSKR